MSREAPELCKSDVLSSPLSWPTAWQKRGCCFPFILPSSGKPKGHLSELVVGERTHSSHTTGTSPLRALEMWFVAMEKFMRWRGKDKAAVLQTWRCSICFWSCIFNELYDEWWKCSSSHSGAVCTIRRWSLRSSSQLCRQPWGSYP